MIRTYVNGFTLLLLACATSGKIQGNCYVDNVYSFEVAFPVEFRLSAHGAASALRVQATKWHSDRTIIFKPLYVISVIESEKELIAVVSDEKNKHFEPQYYMSCEIIDEEAEVINGQEAYVVYFDGVEIEAATAFIDFQNFIVKVEYIVDPYVYDEKEFFYILEHITKQNN
jgi:hypothetical protein